MINMKIVQTFVFLLFFDSITFPIDNVSVLETTVGHWPFSDQFQHLADQNSFWSAKFTVHFQWDGN